MKTAYGVLVALWESVKEAAPTLMVVGGLAYLLVYSLFGNCS